MKLSEALEHKLKIDSLVYDLNEAINSATNDGLFIEVETTIYQTLSNAGNTPKIQTSVKVNPQDID
ncbi:hypothetical protein ACAH42_004487 [Salmonella enterica]